MPRPTSSSLHPPPITTSASSPHLTSLLSNNGNTRKRNSFGSGGGGGGGGGGGLTDSDDEGSISSGSSSMSLPLGRVGGISSGMLHPSSFAPPFYNRPPTPLPPSPSLTSLLRPPFTPSRPTTPDSSDSEAIATSSRIAQSTPRAAPKVPTYEYYGFVLYLVSNLTFLVYIIWSFSPTPLLHSVGIYYFPSRWWSLALPSFLVMLVVYIYVALASYNTGYLTRGLDHLECVVDDAAKIAHVDFGDEEDEGAVEEVDDSGIDAISPISLPECGIEMKVSGGPDRKGRKRKECVSERWRRDAGVHANGGERDWKALWNRGTGAVMDIPVGGVCEVLYGDGREREDWELMADGVGWDTSELANWQTGWFLR